MSEKDFSKMTRIMKMLGCEGENGLYRHKISRMEFNFQEISDDDLLMAIADIYFVKGYMQCKTDLKHFLESGYDRRNKRSI